MQTQESPLSIHVFQHVPFEGPECLETWIRTRRHRLTATHFYRNDPLPEMDDIDWLIVMGGPMGVHDESQFPWLKGERLFIEQAIRRGKAVLGICLGAQLTAAALGANVYRSRFSEIGWLPVELTAEGRSCAIFEGFPRRMQVFQWHNDTFDLPAGAAHIARSEACFCQAFLYGVRVLGLQFHCELTQKGLTEFLKNVPGELPEGPYIEALRSKLRRIFDPQGKDLERHSLAYPAASRGECACGRIQDLGDLNAPEKHFRLANSWMCEIMTRMEWRVKPGF